jgi:hypothetical protein
MKKKGLALSFVQEAHVAKKLESTLWMVLNATPVVSMSRLPSNFLGPN